MAAAPPEVKAARKILAGMPAAGTVSFCCVCGREITSMQGATTREDLGHAPVHTSCATILLPVTFVRRFAEVYAMERGDARGVAQRSGLVVTRDKRYLSHAEVCFKVADVGQHVSENLWYERVGTAAPFAFGPDARAHLLGQAPPPPPDQALDRVLADAVAAAVADGLGGLDAKVASASASVENAARGAHDAVRSARDLVESAASAVAETLDALDKRTENVVQTIAERVAREVLEARVPREVAVRVADRAPVVVGRAHKQFERLLQMVAADVQVWVAGPAGSGKTTAAAQVARALGLSFRFNGAIDSEYKLSGFVDAQGRIVSTAFRRAYSEGGLYLFDEVDSSMPSAVLAFNAALANGHADFPGASEPVERHPDFRCVAAANTWGLGATTEYVGRNKMDAAFLDRFAMLEWPYDEDLEREMAFGVAGGEWCLEVQRLRAAAVARGLKVVISPRATVLGCRLLAAGASRAEALEATVLAKLTKQQREALLGGAQ